MQFVPYNIRVVTPLAPSRHLCILLFSIHESQGCDPNESGIRAEFPRILLQGLNELHPPLAWMAILGIVHPPIRVAIGEHAIDEYVLSSISYIERPHSNQEALSAANDS